MTFAAKKDYKSYITKKYFKLCELMELSFWICQWLS